MQTLKSTPAAYFNKPTMNVHTIAEKVNSKTKSKMGYYYFSFSKFDNLILTDLEYFLTYLPPILVKLALNGGIQVLPAYILDMQNDSGGIFFTNDENILSIAIPASIFSYDPDTSKGYVIDFYEWYNKLAEQASDSDREYIKENIRVLHASEIPEEAFLAGLEEGVAPMYPY